jgi:hypothetical protein
MTRREGRKSKLQSRKRMKILQPIRLAQPAASLSAWRRVD